MLVGAADPAAGADLDTLLGIDDKDTVLTNAEGGNCASDKIV